MKSALLRAALALPLLMGSAAACAQEYPARPVTLVAPFSPGGALDLIARALAQKLQEQWGQVVVVDNKAGAAGIIGTNHVAKAAPDGYTIVLGATTTHGINPSLYKNLQYDAVNDFEPVSLVATIPHLLVVHPKLPINTYAEFEALAKERPLNFGSAGIGSPHHLAGEMLREQRDLQLQHVPYKGSGPAMVEVMSGVIDVMSTETAAAAPYIKSGQLRPIAVASKSRVATLDIPTFAEAGVPDFEVTAWYAVFAPKGTPQEIVNRLSKEISEAVNNEELKARFASLEMTPVGSTPDELRDYLDAEIKRWAVAVEASGTTID